MTNKNNETEVDKAAINTGSPAQADTTPSGMSLAKVHKVKNWSPVWVFPLLTLLIGGWILFYHYRHLGPEVTLITTNAEGIEGGKTAIKSRSVDVGMVESLVLTDDLHHVEIKARLNEGMERLLHSDSVFWVVKPRVGRDGISGLNTLLSGAYIELQPGSEGAAPASYSLMDNPPLAPTDAKGIRIMLTSSRAGQLTPGDPVLFHGYRVGTVETSNFDPQKRFIDYQIFINAPYDRLVTSNVRFWKDSGVAVDLSASGMRVEMSSLTTLLSGGVSFDVPQGWELGEPVVDKSSFMLYDDKNSIQQSLYTKYIDYLMFFKSSVRGLQPGAPVEFRGIRLGTVAKVPFFVEGLRQTLNTDYRIPVLIRIETERTANRFGDGPELATHLQDLIQRGLRGSLKSASLVTGALYVDLNFYSNVPPVKGISKFGDYDIIPTVSSGLEQIQQSLIETLDKINKMPLSPLLTQTASTLQQGEKALQNLQTTLDQLNQLLARSSTQQLPDDLQNTLRELNRTLQGLQPGTAGYNKTLDNLKQLDQVLREIKPILNTLNDKSNALIFEAKTKDDPIPKGAKK